MGRTNPEVLAQLQIGGVLPTYWRRRRATAKWHRGFRLGPKLVHSQCDKIAGLHKGNLLFAPVEEPWPEPHCPGCERVTPGTDAAREGFAGLNVMFRTRRSVGATPDEALSRSKPPTPNSEEEK